MVGHAEEHDVIQLGVIMYFRRKGLKRKNKEK